MSPGRRGRSVLSIPRQPTPPLNRGSPTAAIPSTTFLTLSTTLLTLLQKGLTSRGSSLGAHNPFPDTPPRYIRAVVYTYHFTDMATRRATGAWGRRERWGAIHASPVIAPLRGV